MGKLDKIKSALADYMWSEGCSCCQNIDEHKKAKDLLGKLLNVSKYPDGSGYDFYSLRTESEENSNGSKGG